MATEQHPHESDCGFATRNLMMNWYREHPQRDTRNVHRHIWSMNPDQLRNALSEMIGAFMTDIDADEATNRAIIENIVARNSH